MFRSGMVGFVAIVCFLWLFLGLSPAGAQPLGIVSGQGRQPAQHQVLSSPCGRYVFGQISDSTKDQFMVDTFSGRLWRIAESGRLGMYLKPVPYRTDEGTCSLPPGPEAPQKPGEDAEK